MAERPQPRPARSTDLIDLAGLDQRVAELALADERRQQRAQGNGGTQDSNGSTSAHAEDPLARVASMLTGLRSDVHSMRAAFLELPTMDELDGRMAALETRMATVEAALATTSQQVADLVALMRASQASRP